MNKNLPNEMLAAVLYENEKELKIEKVPLPETAQGECLIQIMACGVCGSDLHITLEQQEKLKSYPRIPGHEASGIVVSSFEGGPAIGQKVIIGAGTACLDCKFCDEGRYNVCRETGVFGFARDGFYAQYAAVNSAFLYPMPEGLDFASAAIIADAVSTPYHALKKRAALRKGESVLVCGAGGLGLHAVKIAKALGAGKIIAVDINKNNLELAIKFGADIAINPLEKKNWTGYIRKQIGQLEVALDFTGNKRVQEAAFRTLGRAGRLVLVGIGKEGFEVKYSYFMISSSQSVLGSFGSEKSDIDEILQLWKDGKLELESSVSSKHALSEVNSCLYNLMDKTKQTVRQLVLPNG